MANAANVFSEAPLQLRKELVLSPTANGGGAWVGLIGTSQIINVQQQNNSVIVCGWVFDAKQKYIYTNQGSTLIPFQVFHFELHPALLNCITVSL